ncbi:MAG: RNA 3'-terminal phosphate cyclase [candidate division WOR-3 bacterium]|nr:MAG: RNA 3'-terminal phosphate cyclase [candidate division WOR-3 bacterium]
MNEIDGSYLEGGGQIIRTTIALSAITRTPVHLYNIRAGREKPGLRPQHIEGIKAAAQMCTADVSGLDPGSTEIHFTPQALHGGDFVIDIKTAGSVTLVMQTLIPVALHTTEPVHIIVRGGTAVPFSPTSEYFEHVLLTFLARMGIEMRVTTKKHGFYPAGGGEISVSIQPGAMRSLDLVERGSLERIEVVSVAHVDLRHARVAERMLAGFKNIIPEIETQYRYVKAASVGCFISSRALFQNSSIGADELGRRGRRAEDVGKDAATALQRAISGEGAIDRWMVDQIIPFVALAARATGRGSNIKIPELSNHARTNMWVVSSFLQVGFRAENNILECYLKE